MPAGAGIYYRSVAGRILFLFIVKGLRGVARLTQWMVPVMAFTWIIMGFGVSLWHANLLPGVFTTIIKSAFGWQEAATGTMAYTLSQL